VRSLIVFLSIFSGLPVALFFPFVGVLLWAWIAFMSPHREAYGLAYDFPFNFYIALTTITAWVISTEPKRLPGQSLVYLLVAFTAQMAVSTFFALDYASAYDHWDANIRTIVLALITIALTTTKARLQAFLWVIVVSIGYFAVKGAGFAILIGKSGSLIYGPDDTMIRDNNHLALAVVVTIPLLHYLRVTSENALVKAACWIVIAMSVVTVIATFSRSGFIGLMAVMLGFVTVAKPRLGAMLLPVALAIGVWIYAPPSWYARINTIQTFQQDNSSIGRLQAWEASWNIAADRPLLGGGFAAVERSKIYDKYRHFETDELGARAAHSIFFEVLGDLGFVGLLLYLAILGACVRNLVLVRLWSSDHAELGWANLLARMMLVSLGGFVAAGAFLSMAYYDMVLCLIALSVPLRQIVHQTVSRDARQAGIEDDLGEDAMQLGRPWRTAHK
jgi:putative inorganic carbon (hco3(-)) transporter